MSAEKDQIRTNKSRYFVSGAFRRFFIPSVLGSFWLAAAGVADSIFVGNGIGAAGLAAISFGQPVYLFYNILSYGFSIGGSIHYAARLAKGREKDGNRFFMSVLLFLLSVYIITCALGILFLPQLMQLLGADPADAVTKTYIRTQFLCVPVMFLQGPFYFFVNADNGPKTAAISMSVSGIADALFSYIFIIRMHLGVAGSVYSTVVGAVLMLLISGSHIVRKRGSLRFTPLKPSVRQLYYSARTGFATSLQYLYQFITMIAVNRLLMNMGGSVAVAAFDVIYNISLLSISIAEGAGIALEPMVSSYRSERNLENIKTSLYLALKWTGILSLGFAALIALCSNLLSTLFGMGSGLELLYTSHGIRLYALSLLPAAVSIVFCSYYQSLLQEWLSYLITFLRNFIFYIMALLLCSRGGMDTIWYVFVTAEALSLLWIAAAAARGGLLQLGGIDVSCVRTSAIDSTSHDIAAVTRAMQDFCEEHGADMKQVMYVGLTIEEICCAITEHFQDRMEDIYIQVTVVADNDETTLYLRDNAYEFNPLAEDTDQIDLAGGHHMELVGIKIVQKKAKEFYYRRYTGFNTLVIRL